ncbi:MAG: hypothetical protein Q8N88_01000 [Nanoarchaeota archaeon]|nr:hypothetical protein [Nanoarchaeota archaeon]
MMLQLKFPCFTKSFEQVFEMKLAYDTFYLEAKVQIEYDEFIEDFSTRDSVIVDLGLTKITLNFINRVY